MNFNIILFFLKILLLCFHMMSRILKHSFGDEEKILKYFSICNRYIKIQIVALLLKWLTIFLAISAGLFFLDQAQLIAIPESKKIINTAQETSSYEDILGQKNFSNNLSNYLNIISVEEVSQWIVSIWLILATIFFLIITPIIIFYNVFYLKISNEFVFTDQRIIVKRGWLETSVKTIYYNQITDIGVSQSLLERIIKSGTLSISTAGSDGYEAILYHVREPYKLKKLLYDIKISYQKKNDTNTQTEDDNK